MSTQDLVITGTVYNLITGAPLANSEIRITPTGSETITFTTGGVGEVPLNTTIQVPTTGYNSYVVSAMYMTPFVVDLDASVVSPITFDNLMDRSIFTGTYPSATWPLNKKTPTTVPDVLPPVLNITMTGDITINADTCTIYKVLVEAPGAVSFTNMLGKVVTVHLTQDVIGGHAVTFPGVVWGDNGVPELLTNPEDRVKLLFESPDGILIDGHLVLKAPN